FAKRARTAGRPEAVIPSGAFLRPPPAPPATAAAPLLTVKDLSSGYGDVQILREVSLEVREKEVVALIGANGAGKTTFLMTLSQIVKPRSGSITFAGKTLTDSPPNQIVGAGIVHVPQGRRLFPGLTVRENLMQGTYLRTDDAKVQE